MTDDEWYNQIRGGVIFGVSSIPEVGGLVSFLVGEFWPENGTDVWGSIQARVEALIDAKLQKEVFDDVSNCLKGMRRVVEEYVASLDSHTPNFTVNHWVACNMYLLGNQPFFQKQGSEILLLPLFTQFANLHLGVLRDAVRLGKSWGWSSEDVAKQQKNLKAAIQEYGEYVDAIYEEGLKTRRATTLRDDHACEPFRSVNRYIRQMTLLVNDLRNLWPYFNVADFPPPFNLPYADREIYADPIGTCSSSTGDIQLPPAPTGPIRGGIVRAWDRINAVVLGYDSGQGPGGADRTPDTSRSGGTELPPYGGRFPVHDGNPIVSVGGQAGDVLECLSFGFADGSGTRFFGKGLGGSGFGVGYAGHMLSSVYMTGNSTHYDCVEGIVLGFKLRPDLQPSTSLVRSLFVTSPSHSPLEAVTQRLGLCAEEHAPIAAAAAEERWEDQRDVRHARLRALAPTS